MSTSSDLFNSLLQESLKEENFKMEEQNNSDNVCLITGEPLTDKYITLVCNHTFNYIPLMNERGQWIKNYKNNSYCYKNKINLNTQLVCPYCRTVIIEPKTNYDQLQELDDIFEDSDDELFMDDPPTYTEKRACVDDIVKRLEEKEITMVDLVSYFDNRYNSKLAPYRPNKYDADIYFIEYMGETIEDIITQTDNEYKEQLLFEIEDIR